MCEPGLCNIIPKSLHTLGRLTYADRRADLNLESSILNCEFIQYQIALIESPVLRPRIHEKLSRVSHWGRSDDYKVEFSIMFQNSVSDFCSELIFLDTRTRTVLNCA